MHFGLYCRNRKVSGRVNSSGFRPNLGNFGQIATPKTQLLADFIAESGLFIPGGDRDGAPIITLVTFPNQIGEIDSDYGAPVAK